MSESQETSDVAEKAAKEIGRLFGELAKQNSKEFPDGGIVLALSSQLNAQQGFLTILASGQLAKLVDKLVQHSEKLTQQTDTLIRLTERAEISNRRIVRLSWILVALTAALLLFTVALYEEAHSQIKSNQFQQQHGTNNP